MVTVASAGRSHRAVSSRVDAGPSSPLATASASAETEDWPGHSLRPAFDPFA
jgi:hypothetical protein